MKPGNSGRAKGRRGIGDPTVFNGSSRQHTTLMTAFAAHPHRFKGLAPKPPAVPTAAWINPPTKEIAHLYRPSRNSEFEAISHLFSATVDWSLIERHYPDFIRLALAIHSGELAPSAVLARINSQSSRDPFSRALQELGHAVRTRFLLRWTWDEELRHAVHKGTTKLSVTTNSRNS
jgi:hypothetical protein